MRGFVVHPEQKDTESLGPSPYSCRGNNGNTCQVLPGLKLLGIFDLSERRGTAAIENDTGQENNKLNEKEKK